MAAEWRVDPRGYDETKLGRCTIIVWTGSQAVDLDDGDEVCEAYVPIGDREYPDGLMLVGRRRLGRMTREAARAQALDLAHMAATDRGVTLLEAA